MKEVLVEFHDEFILIPFYKSCQRFGFKITDPIKFLVEELWTLARSQLLHSEITVSNHLPGVIVKYPIQTNCVKDFPCTVDH